ncbi:hypothetical protein HN358_03520 [Candidatus Uhrbacteria bacterium]|jgi:hypothetical protein|nr:hypothetical protein [Candidatus Uhrbacteria bacterium]MBT7717208.1 hypothetical protein [Candidatus Uhrbacteria bacterium]
MIDTVVIMLDYGHYYITDPQRFSPALMVRDEKNIPFTKHVNNPTKAQKEQGYYPRLTLHHRSRGAKFQQPLLIEFSAPKLLYGNNLDELNEDDFDAVVATIKRRCDEMGVKIWGGSIDNAHVSTIHFGKNIELQGGYTSTLAIQEIAKLHGSTQQDHNKADFRNEGHAYQIYTKSRSVVLYDKMADINKPKSRAIDKDKIVAQMSLFDVLKEQNKPPEILRMEVRYTNRRVLKKELAKLGINTELIFKQLFKKNIAQKVVQAQWQQIYDPRVRFTLSMERKPQAVLKELLIVHPNMTPKRAIELIGMYALARDDAGLLGIRTAIQSLRPKTNWHHFKKRLEAFQDPPFPLTVHGFVDDIESQIKSFKSLRYSVADNSDVRDNQL